VLVATSSPLPPNGLNPLPAQRTRAQAQLARMDLLEKTARSAVLGYCSSSPDFTAQSSNVAAQVTQTPAATVPTVTSSSTVTSSGSGVLDGSSADEPVSPTVVPMGQATPNSSQYGALTVQGNGTTQGSCAVTRRSRPRQQAPAGSGPQWGDPFMRTVLASSSPGAALVSWIEQHPGLAAALFVGGLLAAGTALSGSKKGR